MAEPERIYIRLDPDKLTDDAIDEEVLGSLVRHDGGERRVVEVAVGGTVVVPEIDQRLLETGDAVAYETGI